MSTRLVEHRLAAMMVAFAIAALLPVDGVAAERTVTIESEPPGARVYQLKGFRRDLLGETPLKHSFAVPSAETIVRIAVERSGFERKTLELAGKDSAVTVELVEIPLVADPESFDDQSHASIARVARAALDGKRVALLEALAPWEPIQSAAPAVRSGQSLLQIDLQNPGRGSRLLDTGEVAERFAAVVRDADFGSAVHAVVLSFERRSSGGVSTSVGTRFETEMVCQGAMVPTTVWDNCATRTSTTSSTSYGTSIQSKCVGGTVIRQVYNACARRVPKQKAVVDISTSVETKTRRDSIVEVIDLSSGRSERIGSCEYRNGRVARSAMASEAPAYRAACGPASL